MDAVPLHRKGHSKSRPLQRGHRGKGRPRVRPRGKGHPGPGRQGRRTGPGVLVTGEPQHPHPQRLRVQHVVQVQVRPRNRQAGPVVLTGPLEKAPPQALSFPQHQNKAVALLVGRAVRVEYHPNRALWEVVRGQDEGLLVILLPNHGGQPEALWGLEGGPRREAGNVVPSKTQGPGRDGKAQQKN